MGQYTDFLIKKLHQAAEEAPVSPARDGYKLRYIENVDRKTSIIGWKIVNDGMIEWSFPITEEGQPHHRDSFVEYPDGTIHYHDHPYGCGSISGPMSEDFWQAEIVGSFVKRASSLPNNRLVFG